MLLKCSNGKCRISLQAETIQKSVKINYVHISLQTKHILTVTCVALEHTIVTNTVTQKLRTAITRD